MKVLIFDRKVETLNFLSNQFKQAENEVVIAENGSKFINYLLNKEKHKFDIIIVCRKELKHYGIKESYFFYKDARSIIVCSYLHCEDYHIKAINISSSNSNEEKEILFRINTIRILDNCEKGEVLNQEFIYSLPKKSGILLKHLLINKSTGLSEEEIASLFWGENYNVKMNCIYNHIYNLRKSLKSQFNDLYVIHKEANRYKLIELKKGA